jgi:NADH dehydrogenase (ubiquinone) Fe-S protein 3
MHQYGQYLLTCLPKYIQQFSVYKDELTLYVPPTAILQTLQFLRDHSQCQYKSVMDITAVDFPSRAMRFEVGPARIVHPTLTDGRSCTTCCRSRTKVGSG